MARKLRVWVDHNVCVGNAMCETFAPQVFQLNANRQSEAVNPAGDPEEKILEAAENCPVSAIFVEDADTGTLVPLAMDQACGDGCRGVPPARGEGTSARLSSCYVHIVPRLSLPSVCSYQGFSSHYLLDS